MAHTLGYCIYFSTSFVKYEMMRKLILLSFIVVILFSS